MFPLVRRAAAVAAAGALVVSGLAALGSAQAQEAAAAEPLAASTLRDAAAESGRFAGVAVADGRLGDSTYTNIASTEFNSVTAENSMKWESIQPSQGQYNWSGADRLMNFAQQNNQQVWGHTLVWHSQMPSWLENGGFNATQLDQIMQDHISTVVGRYAGQIEYWDVVNEVFDGGNLRNSMWLQTLGEDYIADAFRYANAADPSAKLCINDYSTDGINSKSTAMYNLVQDLLSQGVPIHCVGFQSHLILDQVPGDYQQNLERFANLGLEVVITELDIRMNTPSDSTRLQRQADQYREVVTSCMNVSGCAGVTVWGVGDSDSWIPGWFDGQGAALLYDENYQKKPAYDAMLEAFGGEPGGGDESGSDESGSDESGSDESGGDEGGTPGDCSSSYNITNQWGSGSVVEVSVTSPDALSGWEVSFDLTSGESIVNGWNGNFSQSGTTVTVTNMSYNGNVPAGGSLNFGFQTDSGNGYDDPTMTLNGATCS